jgi:acetyl-CoA carboxylase biotin carboxyl carrier protein
MNLDELQRILELVREHELSEFELEHEGLKLKIRKDVAPGSGSASVVPPVSSNPGLAHHTAGASMAAAHASIPVPTTAPTAEGTESEVELELAIVKSPIVGTFYRSTESGAPAFVEIGASVKKGQVLCIIEAMKLMNEIDSEYDGEVVNIYAENGQPVQYGERLFAIRTR